MADKQSQRAVEITTPLGRDVLLIHRMTATEALGRLFRFELDLLSENANIRFEDLLGQKISVRLELHQGKTRWFNGHVSRFSQTGSLGNMNLYHATVHPWLWFLTRTADCRIFQKMKVPDIIKKVFRDEGFTDFEESLSGSYKTWEYCVQYRETDFNFLSRLMEQEGIYYYFKHDSSKHTLVLSDSLSSHQPFSGYARIPYYPPDDHLRRERDHIFDWTISQEVQPGTYVLTDYDFERPKANLQVKSSIQRSHARAAMEIFDYPGEYTETNDGQSYVRSRIEELQAEHERLEGQATARGLCVGSLFQLSDYPRKDQDREYLITSAMHEIESDEYESSSGGGIGAICSTSFTAIPSKQPFRPARTTPKPMVQGAQTAVVVGPAGDEIYTDKYGRIKVQFHWDRYGKKDENSSCWVRVAQVWAGAKWGAIHIPRIGHEVMVEFLEGDPDQPIITGRVYNNDNMPPYDLPANSTQSGIKSRSSKGGGPADFNEFRFEDKKGSEEIYLHGQKDWNIVIENDKNQSIGNNETLSVAVNRDKTVGSNQTEAIGVNKTITVGANHTETITGNMTQTVQSAKAETIALVKALTIGGAYQVTVGAAMNETIGAAKAEEIGAAKVVMVGLNSSEEIGVSKSVDAGKDITESAGKNIGIQAGKDISIQAGKNMTLTAGDQIVLKCGSASITMKKNGDIQIKGKNINVKGSGNITLKATKILEN